MPDWVPLTTWVLCGLSLWLVGFVAGRKTAPRPSEPEMDLAEMTARILHREDPHDVVRDLLRYKCPKCHYPLTRELAHRSIALLPAERQS